MKRKRREVEIFSLYFLDGMCCAFGAVIMLLLITKAAEPRIIEQSKVQERGLIAALQQELYEIRGESEVLEREMQSAEGERNRSDDTIAKLQADLTRIRGKFAASRQVAVDTAEEGDLQAARQKLTEEMRRLLASYQPPATNATIGGIPVDSEYIIFVIDSSGSMQSRWPMVIRKVREALEVYPRVKGIQILNGDGRYLLSEYADRWIPDSALVRRRMLVMLENWNANDTSNLVEGIQTAVERFYNPDRSVSVYVFGDDMASSRSVESVVRYIEKINTVGTSGRHRMRIHGVGFLTGGARSPAKFALLMRTLSERNGGTFVALTDTAPERR